MNTYFLKKALREEMRKRRAALTEADRELKSREILRRLVSLNEYKSANLVLSYVSLPYEVDTFALLDCAVRDGKKVAVPRCVNGKPHINFYYISSLEDLSEGSFGILEPEPNPEKLCRSRTGLCVLPGLSFDRRGTRLGYGKGYYDRFLQNFKGTMVGICFSEVLSKSPIPRGRFDVPAEIIVTEKEIIRVSKL